MKYIIVKFKNAIIPFFIFVFTLFLVIYSTDNLIAAKHGLILWAISVVPSLFPFFIATELLSFTNTIQILEKMLNKIMRPIFNVPGCGSFALIMGIISGYPIGAKIVSNFKEQGLCTNAECERLLSFTNNSGPLFIIGTVGISMFASKDIGYKLFIVHLLSCLLVGFLFRWWKKDVLAGQASTKKESKLESTKGQPSHNSMSSSNSPKSVSFYNLGEVLSYSIQSAIRSVLIIGGFVILFSVIVSMLSSSKVLYILSNFLNPILCFFNVPESFSKSIIVGLIEVTNGLKIAAIPSSHISIIICSFLLGFGGISVLLQVLSITSKAEISIKPYILGKFLQAIFSAIFTWIWIR